MFGVVGINRLDDTGSQRRFLALFHFEIWTGGQPFASGSELIEGPASDGIPRCRLGRWHAGLDGERSLLCGNSSVNKTRLTPLNVPGGSMRLADASHGCAVHRLV
nr:hypothetical protein Iba_chr12cCG6490 [Ipomoea batatas]